MADEQGQLVLQRVIRAAIDGDLRAAELLLSRIWPPRRGRRLSVRLPRADTVAGVSEALSATIDAVASGMLTPDEGQVIASMLETKRKMIETAELETRIAKLEDEVRKG
jgi:hypothetical protein